MSHNFPARESAMDRLERMDRPVGRPDVGSRPSGDPAAQLALSVVFPGLATIRRSPVLGLWTFLAGVALPFVVFAWWFANRDRLVGVTFDRRFLLAVVITAAFVVLARLVAVAEVGAAHRAAPGTGALTSVATLVVVAMAVPITIVAQEAYEARGVVGDVFGTELDVPLFVPLAGVPADDDVTNILLFGGDGGPGRWGMRSDTMILAIVHESSGRMGLVSIPRNLTSLRFPPGTPLADRYPDGFDDLTNAVFSAVNADQALRDHYGAGGLQAEPLALSEGLGYSLGIEVDDFALVNMAGFADVVDAVGGVVVELGNNIPLPPSPPDVPPVPMTIGPGLVEMDGALALAYVRTRSADSDYERMARQRQMLAALGSQVSATEALAAFSTVTGVLGDAMRTSMSSGEFGDLLDRFGDNAAIVESVGLTPPLIEPGDPDYAQIAAIVEAVR
ncbi:MAG: LCP family protein, partial [Ilumatobacteraceae bacterium]